MAHGRYGTVVAKVDPVPARDRTLHLTDRLPRDGDTRHRIRGVAEGQDVAAGAGRLVDERGRAGCRSGACAAGMNVAANGIFRSGPEAAGCRLSSRRVPRLCVRRGHRRGEVRGPAGWPGREEAAGRVPEGSGGMSHKLMNGFAAGASPVASRGVSGAGRPRPGVAHGVERGGPGRRVGSFSIKRAKSTRYTEFAAMRPHRFMGDNCRYRESRGRAGSRDNCRYRESIVNSSSAPCDRAASAHHIPERRHRAIH